MSSPYSCCLWNAGCSLSRRSTSFPGRALHPFASIVYNTYEGPMCRTVAAIEAQCGWASSRLYRCDQCNITSTMSLHVQHCLCIDLYSHPYQILMLLDAASPWQDSQHLHHTALQTRALPSPPPPPQHRFPSPTLLRRQDESRQWKVELLNTCSHLYDLVFTP